MKLARYWGRDAGEAGRIRVRARGWSDESVEAARARAREIASRVAERLLTQPGQRNQYGYGDRPLPEPLLREFPGAAITRNAYGSRVLNTGGLMFVDIDREDGQRAVADIGRVAERRGLSVRAYQTAAGYRAMVTDRAFEAGSSESEALLEEFGSDPLYVRLCRMQESFRARLTPKPWRCGCPNPPVEFPFETPGDEAKFKLWESEYNRRAGNYATCRLVSTFGPELVAPEFAGMIACHDDETKASSSLKLA